ncbi:TIM barrel protein [Bauldia sp.]|uniref:TIM barrel protein n=1 Tax=Bauldia sp. TaxID=2575872 RepID=UPI003BACF199
MAISIGNAPCSWGVEFADDPRNPPWQQVLDEAKAAGYHGIELGPIGYLPEDPAVLGDALQSRDLELIAGVLFQPLHDPNAWDTVLDAAHRTGRSLKAHGAEHFVIIDSIAEFRVPTAGRPDEARRLTEDEWRGMVGRLTEVSRIARDEYGLIPSIHAHTAGCIEFRDEIDRVLDEIDEDLLKLCIDTGHCVYAGYDPVEHFRVNRDRTPYLHFKDIHEGVKADAIANRTGFYDATAQGIFCTLGDGLVDFAALKHALEELGYDGWGTVEQDCDPAAGNPVVEDASANATFLKSVGISVQ